LRTWSIRKHLGNFGSLQPLGSETIGTDKMPPLEGSEREEEDNVEVSGPAQSPPPPVSFLAHSFSVGAVAPFYLSGIQRSPREASSSSS
jgi:hypothetical protein